MQTYDFMMTDLQRRSPDIFFCQRITNLCKEELFMNKTFMANPDKVERKWYVVDATGYTLGRLASDVANVLRGKK